jgi:hypothetical protein
MESPSIQNAQQRPFLFLNREFAAGDSSLSLSFSPLFHPESNLFKCEVNLQSLSNSLQKVEPSARWSATPSGNKVMRGSKMKVFARCASLGWQNVFIPSRLSSLATCRECSLIQHHRTTIHFLNNFPSILNRIAADRERIFACGRTNLFKPEPFQQQSKHCQ